MKASFKEDQTKSIALACKAANGKRRTRLIGPEYIEDILARALARWKENNEKGWANEVGGRVANSHGYRAYCTDVTVGITKDGTRAYVLIKEAPAPRGRGSDEIRRMLGSNRIDSMDAQSRIQALRNLGAVMVSTDYDPEAQSVIEDMALEYRVTLEQAFDAYDAADRGDNATWDAILLAKSA
jgi:hypothetical protein